MEQSGVDPKTWGKLDNVVEKNTTELKHQGNFSCECSQL